LVLLPNWAVANRMHLVGFSIYFYFAYWHRCFHINLGCYMLAFHRFLNEVGCHNSKRLVATLGVVLP
jgi:hypothetical protein